MKAVLCNLALISILSATPMYYTFEGTFSSVDDDEAGLISSGEISFGDQHSIVVMLDSEQDGFATYNDGTVEILEFGPNAPDFRHAEFMEGFFLEQTDDGYFDDPNSAFYDPNSHNTYHYYLEHYERKYFRVGSADHRIGGSGNSWSIGSRWEIDELLYNDQGKLTSINFDMNLTSISDTYSPKDVASVPEPATITLLFSGLIGIACIGKNKSRK